MEKKQKRFGVLFFVIIIIFLFFAFRKRFIVSPLPSYHGIMLEFVSPKATPSGIDNALR